jgi:phage gp46-like protein
MPGLDRLLDPVTRDYVPDGRGSTQKTATAQTKLHHALLGDAEKWSLDADSGSTLWQFKRSNASEEVLGQVRAAQEAALRPLMRDQIIDQLEVEGVRDTTHRFLIESEARDVQTGEQLNLSPLMPFGA